MPRIKIEALLLSLATLSVPALAQGTNPAVRDASALNYVQGQATLDGQPVTTNPTGTPRPLRAGDVVATTSGTADLMLSPGTLLRLGDNTSVQLVATGSGRAEARITSGHANVAVNVVRPDTLLLVDMPQGQTQLLERGLYSFNVPSATVRVYSGKADAFPGTDTSTDVKPTKIKDNHEVSLSSASLHATRFDSTSDAQQDLLPWTGPQETRAAIANGAVYNGNGTGTASYGDGGYYGGAGYYGDGGYAPAAYGPYAYGFGFGYPYPYMAYGWPYGFSGYPYGWYGYPWAGIGFGYYGGYGYYGGGYYGGYYGGRRVIGGAGFRSGFPNAPGQPTGGFRGGTGYHAGGFAGGGFHGGGGGASRGGGGGHR